MKSTCPECGAVLPDGGACIDHFHAMLLLEHDVAADPAESAGGRGEVAHFYAVSAYVLQHPAGMNYTTAALTELRQNVVDHLAGRVKLAGLRHKVRRETNGNKRVTRRSREEAVTWPVQCWPVTVADVLAGGVAGYGKRAAEWAESVVRTLDAADGGPTAGTEGGREAAILQVPASARRKRR